MPIKHEISNRQDHRRWSLSPHVARAKQERQTKTLQGPGRDEDRLYEPDWEEASEADVDPYVEILLRDDD